MTLASPGLRGQERAQARIGIRELSQAAPRPLERRVAVAVRAAQLGDLQEAVAAGEVALAHRDLIGEASRALREPLHDSRDPKAGAVALVRVLAGREPWDGGPPLLGQRAVSRQAGIAEDVGVLHDRTVEHVPLALQLA